MGPKVATNKHLCQKMLLYSFAYVATTWLGACTRAGEIDWLVIDIRLQGVIGVWKGLVIQHAG
jgi:hypothetical protein